MRRNPALSALLLWALFIATPAQAAETTISFDDLAPGTVVTSQYQDAGGTGQGVLIGRSPANALSGAPAKIESVAAGSTSSGTHVVSIAGCCGEFNPYGIWGRFPGGPKRLVRVRIGAQANSVSVTAKLVGVSAAGVDLPGVTAAAVVPADGQVKTTLQIDDPLTRIAFFKVVYGSIASPGINGGIPPQHKLDDLAFDTPDIPTPPIPDFGLVLDLSATFGQPLSVKRGATSTTPARIAITRLGGSAGAFDFAASGLPAGVTASFAPDDPVNPGAVLVTLKAGPTTKSSLGGSFTLTATPKAQAAGSAVRSVTVPFTIVENYDLAVPAIEVTQGIQTDGNLPGRPPGSLLPFLAAYDGLPLTARKRTIVSVFGVVAAPAKSTVNGVTVLLYGYAKGKALPGSPIATTSSFSPAAANVGADLVNAGGRRSPAAATVTLPPEWTKPGKITLKAALVPPTVLFSGSSECGSAACAANNSYTLASVPFYDTGYINVAPLLLTVAGQGFPGVPEEFLDRFATLTPLADGALHRADEWRAEYDVTRLANAKTWTELFGGCPFAWSAEMCAEPPDLDALLMSYATDFTSGEQGCDNVWQPQRHSYCFDAVIAMISDANIGNTAGSAGLSKGGRTIDGFGARAVANLRRPLTSIAHELGHGFGLKHASKGCKGGANGQVATDYWPDDWGTIQGIGYDPSGGTMGGIGGKIVANGTAPKLPPLTDKEPFPPYPGAPTNAWYDFMSYCADLGQELNNTKPPWTRVGNAWISTINWKGMLATLRELKRTSASASRLADRKPASAAAARPTTLFASGFVHGGVVVLPTIRPGGGTPSPSVPSPYRLVLRDAAGAGLAEAPMVVQSSEGHGAERLFVSAEVPVPGASGGRLPAKLAAIDVVGPAGVVGGARRTAHAPTVRLRGIKAGARLGRGRTIRVGWRAADTDGDRLTATLEYSRTDGRAWSVLWTGPNRTSMTVPSALLAGSRTARLRVRVSDGFDEARSVSPRFTAVGRRPRVRILSPRPGATVGSAARLSLVAVATDDRLARIPSRRVRWYDGRRSLRSGTSVSVPALRPGTHRLRVVATDSRGRRGSAGVTIRVRATAPRLILSSIPARVARSARKLRLRVATSERAKLTALGASVAGRRRLGAVSTRARTVTVPIRATGDPVRVLLRATAFGRSTTLRLELPRN